jgi:hypothetical protein
MRPEFPEQVIILIVKLDTGGRTGHCRLSAMTRTRIAPPIIIPNSIPIEIGSNMVLYLSMFFDLTPIFFFCQSLNLPKICFSPPKTGA